MANDIGKISGNSEGNYHGFKRKRDFMRDDIGYKLSRNKRKREKLDNQIKKEEASVAGEQNRIERLKNKINELLEEKVSINEKRRYWNLKSMGKIEKANINTLANNFILEDRISRNEKKLANATGRDFNNEDMDGIDATQNLGGRSSFEMLTKKERAWLRTKIYYRKMKKSVLDHLQSGLERSHDHLQNRITSLDKRLASYSTLLDPVTTLNNIIDHNSTIPGIQILKIRDVFKDIEPYSPLTKHYKPADVSLLTLEDIKGIAKAKPDNTEPQTRSDEAQYDYGKIDDSQPKPKTEQQELQDTVDDFKKWGNDLVRLHTYIERADTVRKPIVRKLYDLRNKYVDLLSTYEEVRLKSDGNRAETTTDKMIKENDQEIINESENLLRSILKDMEHQKTIIDEINGKRKGAIKEYEELLKSKFAKKIDEKLLAKGPDNLQDRDIWTAEWKNYTKNHPEYDPQVEGSRRKSKADSLTGERKLTPSDNPEPLSSPSVKSETPHNKRQELAKEADNLAKRFNRLFNRFNKSTGDVSNTVEGRSDQYDLTSRTSQTDASGSLTQYLDNNNLFENLEKALQPSSPDTLRKNRRQIQELLTSRSKEELPPNIKTLVRKLTNNIEAFDEAENTGIQFKEAYNVQTTLGNIIDALSPNQDNRARSETYDNAVRVQTVSSFSVKDSTTVPQVAEIVTDGNTTNPLEFPQPPYRPTSSQNKWLNKVSPDLQGMAQGYDNFLGNTELRGKLINAFEKVTDQEEMRKVLDDVTEIHNQGRDNLVTDGYYVNDYIFFAMQEINPIIKGKGSFRIDENRAKSILKQLRDIQKTYAEYSKTVEAIQQEVQGISEVVSPQVDTRIVQEFRQDDQGQSSKILESEQENSDLRRLDTFRDTIDQKSSPGNQELSEEEMIAKPAETLQQNIVGTPEVIVSQTETPEAIRNLEEKERKYTETSDTTKQVEVSDSKSLNPEDMQKMAQRYEQSFLNNTELHEELINLTKSISTELSTSMRNYIEKSQRLHKRVVDSADSKIRNTYYNDQAVGAILNHIKDFELKDEDSKRELALNIKNALAYTVDHQSFSHINLEHSEGANDSKDNNQEGSTSEGLFGALRRSLGLY